MKKYIAAIVPALVLAAGLCLLLYPAVSDAWNAMHQSEVIAGYGQTVARLDSVSYEYVWDAARAYNRALISREDRWFPTKAEHEEYESLLNVAGSGVMGYVEIPTLSVRLPVYHGADEAVLQVGVGHVEGSSLPVGGVGTHCVLSGHRGLPSAKLFTNLDRMAVGDVFMLHVLDETLSYQVDQILVVEPGDVEPLEIDLAADLCTLVTCTPYGVNTHRLLVRGRRIRTEEPAAPVRVASGAIRVDERKVAALAVAPLLLIAVLTALIGRAARKTERR